MAWLGQRKRHWLGIHSVVVALLGFGLVRSIGAVEDSRKVAQMTDAMKVVRVGRFLTDIPANATFDLGRGFVSGYDISTTKDETDAEGAERLRRLEAELTIARNEDGRPGLAVGKVL